MNDKAENGIRKHFNRIIFKDLLFTLNLRYCKRKRVVWVVFQFTRRFTYASLEMSIVQTVIGSFCLSFDQNSGLMAFSNTNSSKSSKPPKFQTYFFFKIAPYSKSLECSLTTSLGFSLALTWNCLLQLVGTFSVVISNLGRRMGRPSKSKLISFQR